MALNPGVCRFVGGLRLLAVRRPDTPLWRPAHAVAVAPYVASRVSPMPDGATYPTCHRAEKRARAGHAQTGHIGGMMRGWSLTNRFVEAR